MRKAAPFHKWIKVSDDETIKQVKIYGETVADEEAKTLGKTKKRVSFSFADPGQFDEDEVIVFPRSS